MITETVINLIGQIKWLGHFFFFISTQAAFEKKDASKKLYHYENNVHLRSNEQC